MEEHEIVNLSAHGLVITLYKSLEADHGGRYNRIINSCCLCLERRLKRDDLKWSLSKDLQISLNEKVNY